jgi:branched-chain amino acid transport system substrate-binding protein
MKKKLLGIIVGIAIIIIAIIAITTTSKDKETIKIGSILILSGEGSSWGTSQMHGIDLAIKDLKLKYPDKKFEVIHEDDKSSPKDAITAFQKLTQIDNIKFIIGTTWSLTGLPLKELATDNKVVMISPSLGMKEFNEYSKYLFNTWPHDYIATEQLAEYLFAKGIRKVAIIGNTDVWVQDQSKAFTKKFTELGGKIVLDEEPRADSTDLSTEILKLKTSDAEAIVLTSGCMYTGIIAAKKIKEMDIDLPLYSMAIDKQMIKDSEGAYDDMVFFTFLTPSKEFEERYKKEFGLEVEIGGDSAYDAVMLIAQAIDKTKSTDSDKIADYLRALKEYDGVSGHLVSDSKGGFVKQAQIKIIKDGQVIDHQ